MRKGIQSVNDRHISSSGPVADILVSVANWLARHIEKRRTRIDLLELSDDQLRDIGLTPEQAARETNPPWWR